MAEPDAELRATSAELKQRLGRYGFGAARDVRAVAELASGETVTAVVVAVWQNRGWVVAATEEGLRLARRPRLLGRSRRQAFEWRELTVVRSGPQRVKLAFGEAEVSLLAVSPHEEFVALVEEARRHLGGERPSVGELREMAERKLGRLAAFGFEGTIDGLPDRLQPGERVERLAGASLDFAGLLVLTDRRLLLLNVTLRQARERAWEVDRADIRTAEPLEEGLRLVLREGETVLTDFVPAERRDELAAVLSARRP